MNMFIKYNIIVFDVHGLKNHAVREKSTVECDMSDVH